MSKLTALSDSKIKEVVKLYKSGKLSVAKLADKFNVGKTTIYRYLNN